MPPTATTAPGHTKRARVTRLNPAAQRWIRVATSGIHGRGVYAKVDIPAATRLIEYTGEKITKAESVRREKQRLARQLDGTDGIVTIFDLNRRHDLDARDTPGPARLINHSCAPNCSAENQRGHIWIVAKRDIAAGEEITFDYGFPLGEWRNHPCRCGSTECLGFIVSQSQRWRLRRLLREEKKAARRSAG